MTLLSDEYQSPVIWTILVAYVVFVLLFVSAGIGLRHFSHAHELGMADITCENVLYAGRRE